MSESVDRTKQLHDAESKMEKARAKQHQREDEKVGPQAADDGKIELSEEVAGSHDRAK